MLLRAGCAATSTELRQLFGARFAASLRCQAPNPPAFLVSRCKFAPPLRICYSRRAMNPAENAAPRAPHGGERGDLERALGLKEAVAVNMIEIVGIGPFVVSSLVIKAMGGPQALVAWIGGAVLAVLDGFVWSELGAAMPRAGGSYVFLREAYGPNRWGRLMSFLYVWQLFLTAPLSVASASIGFANYARYLHPLTKLQGKALSGGLVIFLVILLYRRIKTIGKISVLLWVGVLATLLWLIWGGLSHFDSKLAFDFPPGAFHLSWIWFAALGSAMEKTLTTKGAI